MNRTVSYSLIVLYIFCTAFTVYGVVNNIILWVIIPLMVLTTFALNRTSIQIIFKQPNLFFYFVLLVWMFLSSAFAFDTSSAFTMMVRVAAGFLMSVVTYQLASDNNNIKWLYYSYIIYFISMTLYILGDGQQALIARSEAERLGNEDINSNEFGYFLFYSTVSVFFIRYLLYDSKSKIVNFILIIFFVLLTAVFSLATASRQVLYIQLVFLSLLLYIKSFWKFWEVRFGLIKFVCFMLLSMVLIYIYYHEFYMDSFLAARTEFVGLNEDPRTEVLNVAINVGFQYPILGVGVNNFCPYFYNIFAHNTYAELFACCGLPSVMIYILLVANFVFTQYHRYRVHKDRNFLLFSAFGVVFAIYNLLYVFVYSIWLMAFFFLVVAHSDIYTNEIENTKIIENEN